MPFHFVPVVGFVEVDGSIPGLRIETRGTQMMGALEVGGLARYERFGFCYEAGQRHGALIAFAAGADAD